MKVARVFRLRDRRGEAMETKEGGFRIIIADTTGGMCYHHNLAKPEGGPRTRWAQKIDTINM
jgi:hypothetical protein